MASNTKFRNFVTIDDSSNLDSFSRIRTSNPVTIFDTQHQYNVSPLLWLTDLVGAGTITHLPNESSIALTCGTASGDRVIRQSKRYLRYQPAKSQFILNTGVFNPTKSNLRQRCGYFDNSNGIFFEQTNDGLYIVRRTNVTGTPVDNRVIRNNWNIDKLDGNGISGFELDITKAQIFVIDAQWLGVGRVRVGLDIDGSISYVHEFYNANVLDKVFTTTFNLPLRFEIENTGITSSSSTLRQICSAVVVEGGFDEERGITHSAGTGITPISVSTRRPVLSVRPKVTFNSIVNRGEVTIDNFSIFTNGNIYYEVILNGTLTNSTFAIDGGVNSITEFDIAATAISGGERLDSGFVAGANASRSGITESPKSKYTLSNNLVGDGTDIITLVATSLTGTNAVNAEFRVKEIY